MPDGNTLNVTLPIELIDELQGAVAKGEYSSTSDAVRQAVMLWYEQRAEDAERIEAIRLQAQRSLNDPRPSFTSEEIKAWIATLPDDGDPQYADDASR